jgi:hypothetical protein
MGQRPMVLLVLIALVAAGCATTMVPVSETGDSPIRVSIAVGDTVRVLTKHGDRPTFQVTDISEEVLFGDDQSIRYDDMAFLEKRTRRDANAGEVAASSVILIIFAGVVTYLGANGIDVTDFY